MILINAEGLIMGRIASFAAKNAMKGEQVVIVNAEESVITGNKKFLLQRFKKRFDLAVKGNPRKGPKASRMPDKMLRRAVRGMLPTRRKTGKEAFKMVKVFIGLPEKYQGKEFVELNVHVDKNKKFVKLGEISQLLGAKW